MCESLEEKEDTAVSRINRAGTQCVKGKAGRIKARGVHDDCLLI